MGDLHLSHQCPQCGAPVELQETDRIFSCPFCQVRLFIHSSGPLRYYIPPRVSQRGDLIYVPYWRLRGSAFVLGLENIQHKILDSSLLAVNLSTLPPSLGLRTQALALRFVEPTTQGLFLSSHCDGQDFKQQLLRTLPGLPAQNGPRLRACIGDSMSLIYQPVFQDKVLVDGISGQHLGPAVLDAAHADNPQTNLSFLSTLCPQCGWDLHGDVQSLVHFCQHCDTAWEAGSEGVTAITPYFLPGADKPVRYLPFWNLRFRTKGFRLQTWADLIRLTNLPRVILPWMESTAFTFRIPAFKIRPELFLNLSARVSLHQAEALPLESLPATPMHPVTLPKAEAFQALPVILGRLTPARKNLFPVIQGGTFQPGEARIEYVPFIRQHNEFHQPEMNLSVQANALHWSSTL